jgi:predicted Zn-ribbon and HTH transcriptional regulator
MGEMNAPAIAPRALYFTAASGDPPVTLRKRLHDLLSQQPRSISSLARELGMSRGDLEDELRHTIRSAEGAGHHIVVVPARCKTCGFVFSEDKLTKPSRCPACKGSRLFEPQVQLE